MVIEDNTFAGLQNDFEGNANSDIDIIRPKSIRTGCVKTRHNWRGSNEGDSTKYINAFRIIDEYCKGSYNDFKTRALLNSGNTIVDKVQYYAYSIIRFGQYFINNRLYI